MPNSGKILQDSVNQVTNCTKADFIVAEDLTRDQQDALAEILDKKAGTAFLRSTNGGEYITAAQAFLIAVQQKGNLFDGLQAGDEPRQVRIKAAYTSDQDHYVVDTELGSVRIREIHFSGDLSIIAKAAP